MVLYERFSSFVPPLALSSLFGHDFVCKSDTGSRVETTNHSVLVLCVKCLLRLRYTSSTRSSYLASFVLSNYQSIMTNRLLTIIRVVVNSYVLLKFRVNDNIRCTQLKKSAPLLTQWCYIQLIHLECNLTG